MQDATQQELSDIFYTSHKKGEVCRVKLNSKGFILQREAKSQGGDEQVIALCDIVGSRCIVCKKERRACSLLCSSASSLPQPVAAPDGAEGDGKKENASAPETADASAYLYVFSYVLAKKNLRGSVRRERTVLKLRFRSFDSFEENMQEAERWHQMLKWHKDGSLTEGAELAQLSSARRFLILLNPKAGSGKAREQFNQQVVPVLNEADQEYDLHVTKHAQYAREFVRLRSLDSYCGIIAVGGDGLFFEILNGLMRRPDWRSALQLLALGVVPCGSGNGLARSIAHLYSEPYEPKPILGASLTLLSGKTAPMDVVRIELPSQTLYSFLSVGWGLISDIDIESERLRMLGYQRFTIWTLYRLVSLRTYRGRISYLLKGDTAVLTTAADGHEAQGLDEQKSILKHSKSCNTYLDKANKSCVQSADHSDSEYDDVISLETSGNQSFRSRCGSWLSAGSRKSTYHSISESVYHSVADESDSDEKSDTISSNSQMLGPLGTVTPLHNPIPDTWTVVEGDFIMVHAVYQTHLGTDCFFMPSARLNDAAIHIIIIRGGISRSQLLNFLIGMSSGTHIPESDNEFIKVVTVTAFRIEPYDDHGIITVDGERVDFGPVQGEVLPGIVRVIVPK